MKTREFFSFLPLINNSVTIGLIFLLKAYQQSHHQKQLIFFFFYSVFILQYFFKSHPYHLSIQQGFESFKYFKPTTFPFVN